MSSSLQSNSIELDHLYLIKEFNKLMKNAVVGNEFAKSEIKKLFGSFCNERSSNRV